MGGLEQYWFGLFVGFVRLEQRRSLVSEINHVKQGLKRGNAQCCQESDWRGFAAAQCGKAPPYR